MDLVYQPLGQTRIPGHTLHREFRLRLQFERQIVRSNFVVVHYNYLICIHVISTCFRSEYKNFITDKQNLKHRLRTIRQKSYIILSKNRIILTFFFYRR